MGRGGSAVRDRHAAQHALPAAQGARGARRRLHEQFRRPYDRLVVANFAGLTAAACGRADVAARWARWGLQHDEDEGFTFFGGACSVYLGWAEFVSGDGGAGLARIDRGLERFAAAGARTGTGLMAALKVEAMLAAGAPPAEAQSVLDDAAAAVAAEGERWVVPYLDLARARVAAASGAGAAAVAEHLADAVAAADEIGIAPVRDLAAALRPAEPQLP